MNEPDHVVEACARAAHEVNRIYCSSTGDDSQVAWERAPEWQKISARNGVPKALAGATPEELHNSWMNAKVHDGWRYGPTKDEVQKTHPCMVKYSALPEAQKRKDALYAAVVRGVALALGAGVRLGGPTSEPASAPLASDDPNRTGPMFASVKTGLRLAFVAHVAFCLSCTENGVMAPFERRRELAKVPAEFGRHRGEGDPSSSWKCDEGRALARAAETAG